MYFNADLDNLIEMVYTKINTIIDAYDDLIKFIVKYIGLRVDLTSRFRSGEINSCKYMELLATYRERNHRELSLKIEEMSLIINQFNVNNTTIDAVNDFYDKLKNLNPHFYNLDQILKDLKEHIYFLNNFILNINITIL